MNYLKRREKTCGYEIKVKYPLGFVNVRIYISPFTVRFFPSCSVKSSMYGTKERREKMLVCQAKFNRRSRSEGDNMST